MDTAELDSRVVQIRELFEFQNLPKDIISEALTAAGADPDIPDGFKKLAQVGTPLIDALIAKMGYMASETRECISEVWGTFNTVKNRAIIAKENGIDRLIKYGPSGHGAEKNLASAVSALIAAIDIGTGSPNSAWKAMLRLGFLREGQGSLLLQAYKDAISKDAAEELSSGEEVLDAASQTGNISRPQPRIPSFVPPRHSIGNGSINPPGTRHSGFSPETNICPLLRFEDDPDNWNLDDPGLGLFDDPQASSPINGAVNMIVPNDGNPASGEAGNYPLPMFPVNSSFHLQEPSMQNEQSHPEHLNVTRQDQTTVPVFNGTLIAHQSSNKRCNNTEIDSGRTKRAATGNSSKYNASLAREIKKCNAKRHPPPCEMFFPGHVEEQVLAIGRSFDTVATMLIQIANASAFLCLRNALEESMSQPASAYPKVSPQTPMRDRVTIIEKLDRGVLYNTLLKRYHVLELFRDCGGHESPSSTRMISFTAENFSSKQPRKGNPKHNDDALITNKMMKEMYPLLSSESPEYEAKRRTGTRLRVLGRRYQVLADKFGKSIICFLQFCNLPGVPDKEVSENMIYKLVDVDFEKFTKILEISQGHALRTLCEAADSVVDNLIYGDSSKPQRIRLQTAKIADILATPKGSLDLLLLLKPEVAPDTHIEAVEST